MLNLTSENQSLLEYIAESQQKMDSNAILESIVKNLEFVICEIPERATKQICLKLWLELFETSSSGN